MKSSSGFLHQIPSLAWINLFFRVVLGIFVLKTGHWLSSDTAYYLRSAEQVCSGIWGADGGRPILYSWYLCALSPSITAKASSSHVFVPLLVQILLAWMMGLVFYRKANGLRSQKHIAILWFFDPILFVFSFFLMTDILFAILIAIVSLTISYLIRSKNTDSKWALLLGAELGTSILLRAVSVTVVFWTLLLMAIFYLKNKKLHSWIVLILGVFIFSGPQVYWNYTRYNRLALSMQGASWQHTVAAAVKFHGTGLDFYESEAKWFNEGYDRNPNEPYHTLFEKFPTWIYLSAKGFTRVMIGHLNVESTFLFTGVSPIGPGWFKVPERRQGSQVSGMGALFWACGVLGMMAYCLWTYSLIGLQIKKKWRVVKTDVFVIWAVGAVFLFAATPQVWGDARFRIAIWPVILSLWIYLANCQNNERAPDGQFKFGRS